MPNEAKSAEELFDLLVKFVPLVDDLIMATLERESSLTDPYFDFVGGRPQSIHKAKIGKIVTFAIADFIAYAFNRPDLGNFLKEPNP